MCECSVVQWNGVGWGGVGWGGSGIGRFMRETKQAMVWVCKCSLRIGGEREEKRRTLCRVFYIAHIGQGKNCHVFIEFFFPLLFFFFSLFLLSLSDQNIVKASITKLLPCTYVHPFFIFNQLQLHLCCLAFF